MLDRNASRASIPDTPDRPTGLNGSSIPFGADEIENRIERGATSTPELVAIDPTSNDLSMPDTLSSDITGAMAERIPIADPVTRAAFLVTNWLVGEGER
jgi:hypothetical protein